ncbi:MAG: hypothetical protein J6A59_08915 [Lachnospiraceae bacterium]|nr:hypothetical protein [Lachnospiraceae bacterium]
MRRSLNDVLREARKESIKNPKDIMSCLEKMGALSLYQLMLSSGNVKPDDKLMHNYILMGVIISYEKIIVLNDFEIERGLRQITLRDFCCMSDHLDKHIDKSLTEGLLSDYKHGNLYVVANKKIGNIIQEASENGNKIAKDFSRINTAILDTLLNLPEEYNPDFNYGNNRLMDYLQDGGIGGVFKLCKDYNINKAIDRFLDLAIEK